nr:annexin D5 [Ipomoea batatas]
MATFTAHPVLTSPRDDAMHLYKAFKGLGCDTAAVINILAHRDATQRALIQQEYRTMYSEELTKRLASELSGKVEKAVLLWMHDPAGRDATIIRQSLRETSDYKAVTEVICSRTPAQLQYLKQIYHSKFGVYLEHDLQVLSGDHQKLLLAYVSTPRHEGPEVDAALVQHDAKTLYKAGEKKLGTDEKKFIQIFSERSRTHLAAVNSAYENTYNSLKKAIKSETSGLFEFGLLTILQCAQNPAKYFAKALHKAMKGMGTDDATLIRIVVTRAEIDMQYIKGEYHKKFKKSLNDAIHSETSGHYRAFLLLFLGPNH